MVKKGLIDRVSNLLQTYECSDCTFLVSGTQFQVHRLILGISSPVFKAMLYGPFNNNKTIEVSDIDPSIFQMLLKFIYTDEVELQCAESAMELLYASKKYLIEYLPEKCVDFVISRLSVDNAVSMLNDAEFLQEKRLIKACLTFVCEHAQYIFDNSVEKISSPSLRLILKCDKMNIKEAQLIKNVVWWAQHFCSSKNIPVTMENCRNILMVENVFCLLRFMSLPSSQLHELIKADDKSLLLPKELNYIESCKLQGEIVSNGVPHLSIERKPREAISARWLLCHRSSVRSASPVVITRNCNKVIVRLKADKTVLLQALNIPSRMSPSESYLNKAMFYSEFFKVTITQISNRNALLTKQFACSVEYDSSISIEFEDPIVLGKNMLYEICWAWPLIDNFTFQYIVSHRNMCVSNKDVRFDFDDDLQNGAFLESLKYV